MNTTAHLLGWSVVGLLYDIVGAIFLVVAIFFNSPAKIAHQAGTYWDSSPFAARALVEQTVDARTGLWILIAGFLFQILGQLPVRAEPAVLISLLILLGIIVVLYLAFLRNFLTERLFASVEAYKKEPGKDVAR